ncbi:MAG: hypothetical protein AAFO94_17525, partial [Bacteroidota bacterium]
MDPIFKKLQFKGQEQVVVLNAPDSFQPHLKNMDGHTRLRENMRGVKTIEFVLAFVLQKKEIDALVPKIAPRLEGDAQVWFAYPKKSSKKYKADFNRDTGWEAMGAAGLEGVRQVAIDEDWSALRFRRV